jgi:hypothetical protein
VDMVYMKYGLYVENKGFKFLTNISTISIHSNYKVIF